jgi:hypothetical protein
MGGHPTIAPEGGIWGRPPYSFLIMRGKGKPALALDVREGSSTFSQRLLGECGVQYESVSTIEPTESAAQILTKYHMHPRVVKMPDITLPQSYLIINPKASRLEGLLKRGTLVLDVGTTLCGPCVEQRSYMAALSAKYPSLPFVCIELNTYSEPFRKRLANQYNIAPTEAPTTYRIEHGKTKGSVSGASMGSLEMLLK